ncbi:unnamed protein product [Rhizoctonia solani]|uniref:1-phosphatidylinositol 4-kinase n=1 Tax=Rhizoctonia solani TaxID=456999 RepID=A0A8H3DTX6_9AGAM|nr:unnamed protein product [Rhizoctonia solani]
MYVKPETVHLSSLELVFEGKAEMVSSQAGYDGLRICRITKQLVPEGRRIVLTTEANPHELLGIAGPSSRLPLHQWEVLFDMQLPGWLPPTADCGHEGGGTSYTLYATATFADSEKPTSWYLSSLYNMVRTKPLPVEAEPVTVELARHRTPTPRLFPEAPSDRGALFPLVDHPGTITYLDHDGKIPVGLLRSVDVIVTAPQHIGCEEHRVPISLRIRANDLGSSNLGSLRLDDFEIELNQTEKFSSRPMPAYVNSFPVPSLLEQPPHMPLLSPHPWQSLYALGLVVQNDYAVNWNQCTHLVSGNSVRFKPALGGLELNDDWAKMDTSVSIDPTTRKSHPARKGDRQLRATVFTPHMRIKHDLRVGFNLTFVPPEDAPNQELIKQAAYVVIPLSFTAVAHWPSAGMSLGSTSPTGSPSSVTSPPYLPAYSQLFYDNGERRDDPLGWLPMYCEQADEVVEFPASMMNPSQESLTSRNHLVSNLNQRGQVDIMDTLDFNLHQLILTELAQNISDSIDAGDPIEEVNEGIELITSKVVTRDVSESQPNGTEPKPVSRVNCNIAFGQFALNCPESHVESTVTVLIGILRDVPHIDYERSLRWSDWSLPDELVFVTVCALLRLASLHPTYRESVMAAIVTFAEESVKMLGEEPAAEVIIHVSPAFHGLYRAVTATPFPWKLSEWLACSKALASLFSARLVERLNAIVEEFLQRADEDPALSLYVQTFLARYKANERPLSGYFAICSIVEIQWTALAQALAPPVFDPNAQKKQSVSALTDDAEASNMAWAKLMRQKANDIDNTQDGAKEHLQQTVVHTMKYFNDLLMQVEDMEDDPDNDTYTWETMSETLKLASLCCVALGDLDSEMLTQLKLLLSDVSPAYDNFLQEGALTSLTVLVHNFPETASSMAHHLRKFITAPLPLLEFHFASDPTAPTVLAAAANCLAVAPDEDFLLSFIYSLLNYITATNQDMDAGTSPYIHNHNNDSSTVVSIESGLRNKTDLEKRRIGMSTISVITRLALIFKREDVTKLCISLLMQRLPTAHPSVQGAISYNLVDLALAAPQSVFSDIIRVFSQINRVVEGAENSSEARSSSNQVLAAQTRLAHELKSRPELYETYLVELLIMFVDKGTAIQTQAGKDGLVPAQTLAELVALTLPIDALIAHSDFHPDYRASGEVTALFRNMWFICGLFRLSSDDKADMINDWQYAAMTRIAAKTPPVVLEEAQEYLTNAIEYNPIFRNDYLQIVVARHRTTLTKFISTRGADIRYLTPPQIVFLLTMHDLENMRAKMFLLSSLVWYFSNEALNKNAPLMACMDGIAEKVIRDFVNDTMSRRIVQHSISPALSAELRKLLVASTHRIAKIRELAMKYLQRLITAFPSLLCDPPFVVALLEVLTLMHRACEGEFTDEFTPQHDYHSQRADITLELSDSYASRNEILSQLYKHANRWLEAATARAPIEIQATLQNYLADTKVVSADGSAELGATIALQFAKTMPPSERKQGLDSQSYTLDRARVMVTQITSKSHFGGEAGGVRLANRGGVEEIQLAPPTKAPFIEIKALKAKLAVSVAEIRDKTSKLTVQDLRRLLFRCAAVLMALPEPDHDLLHYLVAVPFAAFTTTTISTGVDAWTWLIGERKDMEIALMLEFNTAWASTVKQKKGIFSSRMDFNDPFRYPVGYNPTNKSDMDKILEDTRRLLVPHTILLQMLRSRFQAVRYKNPGLMQLLLRLVLRSTRKGVSLSTHALAREPRFSLLIFGFEVLRSSLMDTYPEARLREALYRTALSWFAVRPQWSFGANLVQVNADIKLLNEFLEVIQHDNTRADHVTSSLQLEKTTSRHPEYLSKHRAQNSLLKLLIENEISRLRVWANPTSDLKRGQDYLSNSERSLTDDGWRQTVRTAWSVDAAIATHMAERFKRPVVENELTKLVRNDPSAALHVPEAVKFFIGDRFSRGQKRDHKLLLTWDPVPPVVAIKLFEPQFDNDPITLQYAHRVLAQHPVDVTFFYVPQIVQALRNDAYGYVERFIFETAKVSQLFCHQIIWNMQANGFKDDAAEVADPMKPMLDRMTEMVVASLSGEARGFYEREFKFFEEVTSISGKLKPFIKKTKQEKKDKIDEEMAKIVVEEGCYLPSNPDGIVVDIDKRSGRPLQSHAKAPFMATFKVRKERTETMTDPNSVLEGAGATIQVKKEYDVWQAAIFKVGDDCRQDVLALQIIAMFKNIFTDIGLMLYLYPYRVTATGPGCGVIDVVPNATSRDEMGRSKTNDLMAFFIMNYGSPDTITFQKARLNFIQSMAAYSVACYILQIKDRHNGNIMIDGEGHIVHIDFGFLFDIDKYFPIPVIHVLTIMALCGVKFEPNSFKLNHEMIALMGGKGSQGFNLFVQLTVKAFLAIRPHVTQLVDTVSLMLGAEFPSFKGEPTIKRLQDRFVPQMTERQAADWMMGVIRNAQENVRSTFYDEFQRLQNGIPYA